MPTRDLTLDDLSLASVERFRVTVRKDGAAWDLSDGTVTIKLVRPDKTVSVEAEMTAEDGEGGVFYYDTLVTDLDEAGYWSASLRIVDNAPAVPVSKDYPYSIGFYVADPEG
jgi:hypothetical protein